MTKVELNTVEQKLLPFYFKPWSSCEDTTRGEGKKDTCTNKTYPKKLFWYLVNSLL